jgi:Tol biopolymer transport system component
LRFTVNRAINRRIASSLWEMDLNADSAHQLLPDWNIEANQCCGVWSPDGRNFAFTVIQNDRLSLWAFQERRGVWKSEHTRPTRIGPETLNVATPVFSEDGASLWAYVWDSQIELQRYEVQTATLVPHHGGISAVHASYSRDGAWIVYASHPDRSLWRARADGTEPRRLTDGGDVDGCYFSPDGRRIAFRARFNGQQKRVYVIPSDGSGAAEPLTAKDIEQGIPTWSNDGRYLVYGDVAEDFHRPTETRLRVYDFQRRTTDEIPGSAGLWTSRWSPDGKYIAALDRRHEERVMLFDTQSRRWRTLPEATHVDYPNWSSDSAYIYYSASRADGAELRRVSISDGRVQSLINLPAANVSAAYGWAGLTPDDRPLIARLDVPQVSQLELRPH